MATLTPRELELLAPDDRPTSITLKGRPIEQWAEILKELSPPEAAARIMGDLVHYQSDRKKGFDNVRSRWFLEDVAMLATALQGFASLSLATERAAFTVTDYGNNPPDDGP